MAPQLIHQVIYIGTSREALWSALTTPEITELYWGGTRIESDWQLGSNILYRRDGEITDVHTIEAIDAPDRLVHTFAPIFGEFKDEKPSRVSIELTGQSPVVRLTVTHSGFPPDSKVYKACQLGWPMILSNLKSLLETGKPIAVFNFEP